MSEVLILRMFCFKKNEIVNKALHVLSEYVLTVAYAMTTFAMATVYVITALLSGAILFGLQAYSAYMSFLFVFVAALYPVAGK